MLGPRSAGVQQLRRLLSSRRDRREAGAFAFEGPELLRAALDQDLAINRIFRDERASKETVNLVARAMERGIKVDLLDSHVFASVSDAQSPQGCIGIAERISANNISLDGPVFAMVLDEIQDPGNLGALLRVAEGCGVDVVFITGKSADPYGPKALRSGVGSTFRTNIVEVNSAIKAIDRLHENNVRVLATSSHEGKDFATTTWPDSVALVLGNEGSGINAAVIERCDEAVQIPLAGSLESLNVSVAAGILAMSVFRSRETSRSGLLASTMNAVPTKDLL